MTCTYVVGGVLVFNDLVVCIEIGVVSLGGNVMFLDNIPALSSYHEIF